MITLLLLLIALPVILELLGYLMVFVVYTLAYLSPLILIWSVYAMTR